MDNIYQTVRLKDICAIKTGHNFRKAIPFDEENYNAKILQISNLHENPVGTSCNLKGIFFSQDVKKSSLSNKPCLLVAAKGNNHQCYMFSPSQHFYNENIPIIPTNHIFILNHKESLVDINYLQWILNQPITQQYFILNSQGSKIQSKTKKTIENTPIVVPPLSNQREIATLQIYWQEEKRLTTDLLHERQKIIDQTCHSIMEN